MKAMYFFGYLRYMRLHGRYTLRRQQLSVTSQLLYDYQSWVRCVPSVMSPWFRGGLIFIVARIKLESSYIFGFGFNYCVKLMYHWYNTIWLCFSPPIARVNSCFDSQLLSKVDTGHTLQLIFYKPADSPDPTYVNHTQLKERSSISTTHR